MKKRYLLPVFVLAGLAVQAQAACTIQGSVIGCCWYQPNEGDGPSDNCWDVGPDQPQYGGSATAAECTADHGTFQQNCDPPSIEYCRWETSCWPIESGGRAGCVTDGSIYINVPPAGVGAGKQCEGGTWTGDGKDPNRTSRGYCNWGPCVDHPTNQYSCTSGGCFEINDAQEEADCPSILPSKAACPSASLPPADRPAVVPPTSTQKMPAIAGLIVVPHGRALHISSPRDANVTLYDLSGNRVFGGKVRAGNSVFSLTSQAPGVYYAVVQSGSLTQTANVVLK